MLTNMSLWAMAAAANADLPFLTVFVLGFGTVFVGLLMLILIISLLGKIMKGSAAKEAEKAVKAAPAQQPAAPVAAAEPAPAPAPAVEEIEDRQSMVAAISAAIATVMGEDVSGIRILSITKVD